MPRLLTALVASAALATSSLPAHAEMNVDPGVVVGGLITLGLLGAVLSDRNDRDDHHKAQPGPVYKVAPVTRQPQYLQEYPRQSAKSYRGDDWNKPGHGYGHVKGARAPLPAHCLRDVSRPGDTLTLYGQNCLSQSRVSVKALPDVCAVRVPTQQGLYTGYAPSCLQARGYRAGWR